jgi:pimeloyl-ACP methyl ester carboxylesterase
MLDATQWGARAITGRPAAGTPTPERYEVPMLFLMGRYDLHTPYTTALARFERLEAPLMRFITFERSAHFMMLEEPSRLLEHHEDGREMIRRDIDRRPAASYRRCHGRWIPGRALTEATLAVLPMLFGS